MGTSFFPVDQLPVDHNDCRAFAEKYFGNKVNVVLKAPPPGYPAAANPTLIGYHKQGGYLIEFDQIVGLGSPGMSGGDVALRPDRNDFIYLKSFSTVWTCKVERLCGVYFNDHKDDGKYPSVPTKSKKRVIPDWPHVCRDCGSPGLELGTNLECSNNGCKNWKAGFTGQIRYGSGLDLLGRR